MTGVQTCALPISANRESAGQALALHFNFTRPGAGGQYCVRRFEPRTRGLHDQGICARANGLSRGLLPGFPLSSPGRRSVTRPSGRAGRPAHPQGRTRRQRHPDGPEERIAEGRVERERRRECRARTGGGRGLRGPAIPWGRGLTPPLPGIRSRFGSRSVLRVQR